MKPLCAAKTSAGNPCKRPPIAGATVCRVHGGSAPQVKAAAAARVAEQRARDAVERFSLPRDVDPHVALLEEVHRTAGQVAYLQAVMADIAGDESGKDAATRVLTQYTEAGRQPSVWVRLLGDAQDRLVKAAVAAIKAGVEERQVRLAEDQGALVMQVLQQVILALPPEHRETARVAAAQQLRLVAAT